MSYSVNILKISVICFALFSINLQVFSQNVGISSSGTAPQASAGLDVNYSDKGVLIPRVNLLSNTDIVTVPTPVVSLMVYNTGVNLTPSGFYYWNGTNWINFGAQGVQGPAGSTGAQGIQGATGPAGPQGNQGPIGNNGATGPAGPQGNPGPTGNNGATGAQGPAGPQGNQGPTGPAGSSSVVDATYFASDSRTITSTSPTNFTVPTGVTNIHVTLVGGGGSGGGGTSSAGNGSYGGVVVGELAVTPGETLIITVGAGGTNPTAASGSNSAGKGGKGTTVKRGSTLLAAAGGGGGGAGTSGKDGVGGGASFGTSVDGGNAATGNGGASGNNFVAYLQSFLAFKGANSAAGTTGPATGVTSAFFTVTNNGSYGEGDTAGGTSTLNVGKPGVVIIKW